jgi:hypothetical protein
MATAVKVDDGARAMIMVLGMPRLTQATSGDGSLSSMTSETSRRRSDVGGPEGSRPVT